MTSQWLLLLAVIFVGGISSYTTTVASRGPEGEAVLRQRGPRSILGGLSVIAIFSSIIWGFIHLPWYWVLLAVVGILFLNGIIYGGRAGFVFWYSIQPVLNLLCIAGTLSLWFLL